MNRETLHIDDELEAVSDIESVAIVDNTMDSRHVSLAFEDIQPGVILSQRYLLMQKIALGGNSVIYRARDLLITNNDLDSHGYVAIKIINPEKIDHSLKNNKTKNFDAKTIVDQLLIRELLASQYFSHENIINIHSLHTDGELNYLVMELITGKSLVSFARLFTENKLSYRQCMAIIEPCIHAVQAMHDKGFIHSDIKPANIMVSDSGIVKIIDFATTRDLNENNSKKCRLPKMSFVGYTKSYASPQTLSDQPANESDDVYSISCIIYELLMGFHPFERKALSENDIQKVKALKKPSELSFWQWNVLKKGLHPNPEKRTKYLGNLLQGLKSKRFFTHKMLAASVLLMCGVYSYNYVSDYYQSFDEKYQSYKSAFITNKKVVELAHFLKSANENEILNAVSNVDQLGDYEKAAALAVLKPFIIKKIENSQMVVGNTNDFDKKKVFFDQLTSIYPDSISINQLKSESYQAKQAFFERLEENLYTVVEQTDFSESSIHIINKMVEQIKIFDKDYSLKFSENVLNNYQAIIDKSVILNDVYKLGQLYHFANAINFKNSESMFEIWNGFDNTKLQSFLDLYQYKQLGGEYPKSVINLYIEPMVVVLQNDLKKAWATKKLLAIKSDIKSLNELFFLPKSNPIYQDLISELILKINNKISYYEENNSYIEVDYMKSVLDDINSTMLSTTESFIDNNNSKTVNQSYAKSMY